MGMERAVLITGAYGGMGRATVRKFREMGFRVFALDRSISASEEASPVAEDAGVDGCGIDSGIMPIQVDITDEESVRRAFEAVKAETDSLYGIIHFAGIYMLDSLVEMDSSDFEKIFRINLGGVFLVNKMFLSLLGEGSRILITTSELAPLDPLPFTGIYAVTKAALDKYAYSLRMELQLKGIKVSVLRAGAVETGMLGVSTDALDRFCKSTELYSCNAERFKRIVDSVEARSITPCKIAAKASRILEAKNPCFAYSINRNPLLLLLNLLPRRMQFWVIRLLLKNKKEKQ